MIIGLVVLGPERLPRIANQIGGWLGQARRMTRVMKRQLEEELDLNKPPTIKPPPSLAAPSQQPAEAPNHASPRDDDEHSAAHGEDDIGTGVGEEIYDDESDLAVTEAEREAIPSAKEQESQTTDDTPEEKKEPS